MRRFRGSFLLRSWEIGQAERFEVEHIQSGAHVTVTTLAGACGWIAARQDAGAVARPAEAEAKAENDSAPSPPDERELGGTCR